MDKLLMIYSDEGHGESIESIESILVVATGVVYNYSSKNEMLHVFVNSGLPSYTFVGNSATELFDKLKKLCQV